MQAQGMMRRQAPTWQAPLLSSLKEESIDCLQLSVSRVAHVCPSEMTGGWRSVDMEITFIGLYIVDGWGSTVIVYCCACCCYLSFILFFVPFGPFCSSLLCFFSFLVFLVAAGAWWLIRTRHSWDDNQDDKMPWRFSWGVLKDGRKKWGSFICQKTTFLTSMVHTFMDPFLSITQWMWNSWWTNGSDEIPWTSKITDWVQVKNSARAVSTWTFEGISGGEVFTVDGNQNSGEKTTWDGAKTLVNNGRCSTTFPSTAATLNWSSNLPIQRCIMNYHENPPIFPIDYGRDDWKSTSGAWGLSCWNDWIHPGRLTWNLRIHPWKRKIIFQTIIFRFYVNLQGCMSSCQAMQLVHHCQQESTQLRLGWETPMYPDFSGRDSYPAQHHQARHGTRLVKVKWWNKTMGGRRW